MKWLNENYNTDNFEDIVKRWKTTSIHRQKVLEEEDKEENTGAQKLFRMWPHYKLPRGYQLVSI